MDVTNNGVWIMKVGLGEFLFSPNGRVSRKDYWLKYFIPLIIIEIVVVIIAAALASGDEDGGASTIAAIIIGIWYLAIIWPSIAIQVKRWHDRGKSGWWMFIALVPIVGPIYAFVQTGCLGGQPGENRFGPDPLAD